MASSHAASQEAISSLMSSLLHLKTHIGSLGLLLLFSFLSIEFLGGCFFQMPAFVQETKHKTVSCFHQLGLIFPHRADSAQNGHTSV